MLSGYDFFTVKNLSGILKAGLPLHGVILGSVRKASAILLRSSINWFDICPFLPTLPAKALLPSYYYGSHKA